MACIDELERYHHSVCFYDIFSISGILCDTVLLILRSRAVSRLQIWRGHEPSFSKQNIYQQLGLCCQKWRSPELHEQKSESTPNSDGILAMSRRP